MGSTLTKKTGNKKSKKGEKREDVMEMRQEHTVRKNKKW